MKTGAQRAVGWWKTVKGIMELTLEYLPQSQWLVGADGIHRYMEGI